MVFVNLNKSGSELDFVSINVFGVGKDGIKFDKKVVI